MILVSLRTFLETGEFGQIRLGMSRQQILDSLGHPDTWNKMTPQEATIWKYGSIELYFPAKVDSIFMIFCDNLNPLTGGENIDLQTWLLSPDWTLTEAVATLQSEGLIFTQTVEPITGAHLLRLASGVELSFEGDPAHLTAFVLKDYSLLPHTTSRQISITITEAEYERLRQEAVRRYQSMSKIASAWVSEQIASLPDEN